MAIRDIAQTVGLPLDYRIDPGCGHDWGYWEEALAHVLKHIGPAQPR